MAKLNRYTEPDKIKRRSRIGVLAAALVLMFGAVWALVNQDKLTTAGQAEGSLLQHDVKQMWSWSDGLLESGAPGAGWTLRWYASGEAAKLREQLFPRYEGDAEGELSTLLPELGGKLSMSVTATAGQGKQQMLLLFSPEQSKQADQHKLLSVIKHIESAMRRTNISYDGGITIRGLTEYNNVAERLAQLAAAEQVDRYDDAGTVSESFFTGGLKMSVRTGDKEANMQVAVHKGTDTGKLEVVIGIPLISGDYSALP
ncbi:TATA-box binding [Paenibacillus algorifonticola]|uniref:TATA-box binding n=1 Tax=Paenibacillus algorifonticola TaxID=684063 RepID=A0A1I2FUK9_9BACL|nr:YwmB family TATA-box binding protein [Paenibacillus algorifonticola]SFF08340.1 TATA-box binding [Paenibacillus algorifonticola]